MDIKRSGGPQKKKVGTGYSLLFFSLAKFKCKRRLTGRGSFGLSATLRSSTEYAHIILIALSSAQEDEEVDLQTSVSKNLRGRSPSATLAGECERACRPMIFTSQEQPTVYFCTVCRYAPHLPPSRHNGWWWSGEQKPDPADYTTTTLPYWEGTAWKRASRKEQRDFFPALVLPMLPRTLN